MPDTIPVVLVTGGSRGLGRGIVLQLAEQGYSVAINYASNAAAAEETASACLKRASNSAQCFMPVQADISKPLERETMVSSIITEMGRIDGLVNNAGIAPSARDDILVASESSFEKLMSVNLQGPYFLTQTVARHWLEQKPSPLLKSGFIIIFVTSLSAYTSSVSRGEYCISKAGLSMAAQLWADRLAGEGVQVLELRPGIMLTDMTGSVKEKYDDLIAGGRVPQKKWGTPEDMGLAVTAILNGHFPFSTGAVIDIDGGFSIRSL
ncbi:MAG: 3-ketoacyl-ACP reductase [Deltaproteobacteria bacterium]|jgi:3-oxoacyl-[acyl-carrier protein] reductase|nr:3-ketoacyl-ACP reductase [Deltaproteobacteria bacterium]MBT6613082.1 3-ketoacyl-ACP reductase [Deltaproteobacteria bacterium]MBT7153818.1 3-ketoacyl-ACP reductase [Deltaproteobacteria bacterium]MBT7714089.1 3-ketoacyl-ACP reductase [Deltaproteobacteria bacterium]